MHKFLRRDDKNSQIVSCVYISQRRGDKTSYYHYDGIGSTRALTDSNTNITDTYMYDLFGVMTSRTGVTKNDYLLRRTGTRGQVQGDRYKGQGDRYLVPLSCKGNLLVKP